MPVVRFFAQARDAAGTASERLPGSTVDEVLEAAGSTHGDRFTAVLSTCRIWVNGEPAVGSDPVADDDEVAVLPPVSGG